MAVLSIYRVRLKGTKVLWAVVHGVAYTKEEACAKSLALYTKDDPTIIVEKCSPLEECKFTP